MTMPLKRGFINQSQFFYVVALSFPLVISKSKE